MTSLPRVSSSEVNLKGTQFQLDMDSSPDTDLSRGPAGRARIALLVNRQKLVDTQVSWAAPGVEVADGGIYVQGQPGYKPPPGVSTTTTIPTSSSTSSTPTTTIDSGGERELPDDTGPEPVPAFVTATGAGPRGRRSDVPLGLRRTPSRYAWPTTRQTPGRRPRHR